MNKTLAKEYTETTLAIQEIERNVMIAAAKFKTELATLKEKEVELHEKVKASMESSGVHKFENDILKITYIAPSTRNSIDVTKLKEELPQGAKDYTKSSVIKSSIRIKIKETV